jgi:hypothetical protein
MARKIKKLWNRFNNWLKMEIELAGFVGSVEASNMPKYKVDERIQDIKRKYKKYNLNKNNER